MMRTEENDFLYRIDQPGEPHFSESEDYYIRQCLFYEIIGKKPRVAPPPFTSLNANFSSLYGYFSPKFIVEGFFGETDPQRRDAVLQIFESRLEMRKRYLSETAEMVRVNGGSFRMGNTSNDPEGCPNETPVHDVRLNYDFWIGKYPVTDYEFLCFLNAKNKTFQLQKAWSTRLGTRPVVMVKRKTAMDFCNWLSASTGLKKAYDSSGSLLSAKGKQTVDVTEVEGYRLPTEAEWEYAARGGHRRNKDLPFSGHKDPRKVAWFNGNARGRPHEVGRKKPNALGIYDLCGNVCEWCQDGYHEYPGFPRENPLENASSRFSTVRGGSWFFPETYCRIAARFFAADSWYNFIGFRLCRTITDLSGSRQ